MVYDEEKGGMGRRRQARKTFIPHTPDILRDLSFEPSPLVPGQQQHDGDAPQRPDDDILPRHRRPLMLLAPSRTNSFCRARRCCIWLRSFFGPVAHARPLLCKSAPGSAQFFALLRDVTHKPHFFSSPSRYRVE